MELLTLLGIAIGLSFDSFAVSLSYGAVDYRVKFREAFKISTVLAVFQGGFTVGGFFLGSTVSSRFNSFDHWIAMALLTVLGIRMIANGMKPVENGRCSDIASGPGVLAMAVSTSMDALAVGVSLAFLLSGIWFAGAVITVVTFMAAMIAIRIGKMAGKLAGQRIEIVGGILLIIIGMRIVMSHYGAL
jgi:manganese efflux pump family protein